MGNIYLNRTFLGTSIPKFFVFNVENTNTPTTIRACWSFLIHFNKIYALSIGTHWKPSPNRYPCSVLSARHIFFVGTIVIIKCHKVYND